jgi:hypothetical protein
MPYRQEAPKHAGARQYRLVPCPTGTHLGGQSLLEIVRQFDQQMNDICLCMPFLVRKRLSIHVLGAGCD